MHSTVYYVTVCIALKRAGPIEVASQLQFDLPLPVKFC